SPRPAHLRKRERRGLADVGRALQDVAERIPAPALEAGGPAVSGRANGSLLFRTRLVAPEGVRTAETIGSSVVCQPDLVSDQSAIPVTLKPKDNQHLGR